MLLHMFLPENLNRSMFGKFISGNIHEMNAYFIKGNEILHANIKRQKTKNCKRNTVIKQNKTNINKEEIM